MAKGISRMPVRSFCPVVSALALVLVAGALPPLGANQAAAQQHAGEYERADIEQGFRLYGINCAGCHGSTGEGIPNAQLRAGAFRHATSDAELKGVIAKGIQGTAMPPHSGLTDTELTAL